LDSFVHILPLGWGIQGENPGAPIIFLTVPVLWLAEKGQGWKDLFAGFKPVFGWFIFLEKSSA
jgi:hypothetical protein